jgi:Nif-specific regulatory protein
MKQETTELELRVFYEITRTIRYALNLDQMLDSILAVFPRHLVTSKGAVVMLTGDRRRLTLRAQRGFSANEIERGSLWLDELDGFSLLRRSEPWVLTHQAAEPLFLGERVTVPIEKRAIKFMAAAIIPENKPIGFLAVDRIFDESVPLAKDLSFLRRVADFIAEFVALRRRFKLREASLVRSNRYVKSQLRDDLESFLTAQSHAMKEVAQLLRKVAPTRANVLLIGEPGTGKSLAAKVIHELSPRAAFPFIAVGTGKLPQEELEAELFGRNADENENGEGRLIGRIEEASGGTLYLNEMRGLPMSVQAHLVRFLQYREFEPAGAARPKTADVRVIAATRGDLETAVREGGLREDLYYRLNVFPVRLPPLRERREDLEPLINHFLRKQSFDRGTHWQLTPEALEALMSYKWPGNVAELKNLVERFAMTIPGGTIGMGEILRYVGPTSDESLSAVPLAATLPPLREIERRNVIAALERNKWIQSRAARELGITLRQMGYRIKKFGLEDLLATRKPGK